MTNKKSNDRAYMIIGLIAVAAIVAGIMMATRNGSDDNEAPAPMSVIEAHNKCVVLELVDLWLYNPDHSNIRQRAEDSCLLLWNTPESEKEFPGLIQTDWENHKDDVVDGQTLQELYDELFDK